MHLMVASKQGSPWPNGPVPVTDSTRAARTNAAERDLIDARGSPTALKARFTAPRRARIQVLLSTNLRDSF